MEDTRMLSTYLALGDTALTLQNKLYQEIIHLADVFYNDLNETARFCYHFWRNFNPQFIKNQTFTYIRITGS